MDATARRTCPGATTRTRGRRQHPTGSRFVRTSPRDLRMAASVPREVPGASAVPRRRGHRPYTGTPSTAPSSTAADAGARAQVPSSASAKSSRAGTTGDRAEEGRPSILRVQARLAYGASGWRSSNPPDDATLQFEVELFSWKSDNDLFDDGGCVRVKTLKKSGAYAHPRGRVGRHRGPLDGAALRLYLDGRPVGRGHGPHRSRGRRHATLPSRGLRPEVRDDDRSAAGSPWPLTTQMKKVRRDRGGEGSLTMRVVPGGLHCPRPPQEGPRGRHLRRLRHEKDPD